MAYNLVFRRGARDDLLQIESYLSERSATGVTNVLADIDEALVLLKDFPKLGREIPNREARVKLSLRYRIVYSLIADDIIIRQIIHPSRNAP